MIMACGFEPFSKLGSWWQLIASSHVVVRGLRRMIPSIVLIIFVATMMTLMFSQMSWSGVVVYILRQATRKITGWLLLRHHSYQMRVLSSHSANRHDCMGNAGSIWMRFVCRTFVSNSLGNCWIFMPATTCRSMPTLISSNPSFAVLPLKCSVSPSHHH